MKRSILILSIAAMIAVAVQSAKASSVGDFNNDGRVNIFDVLSLLQVIAGKAPAGDIGKQYVLADGLGTLPGQVLPIDTIQGVPMVHIPAGSFVMGAVVSPMYMYGGWPMHMGQALMHPVGVDSFWISSTEITRGLYEEIMGSDPSKFTWSDSLPVHGLSWYDAVRFCNTLSLQAGLRVCYDTTSWSTDSTANGFRLPTEAEWEYACRANSATFFYTGNEEQDLEKAGWYLGNSEGGVQPIAQKLPNNWGLYDMMGNVWEWCNDWYDQQYYGQQFMWRPFGPSTGMYRVMRGGAYDAVYSYCSPAFRYYQDPGQLQDQVGLRVVKN